MSINHLPNFWDIHPKIIGFPIQVIDSQQFLSGTSFLKRSSFFLKLGDYLDGCNWCGIFSFKGWCPNRGGIPNFPYDFLWFFKVFLENLRIFSVFRWPVLGATRHQYRCWHGDAAQCWGLPKNWWFFFARKVTWQWENHQFLRGTSFFSVGKSLHFS